MKANILKVITWTAKAASVMTGLAAYMHYIPEQFKDVAIITFAAASLLKDTVNRIGDLVDDGKENNSFEVK